MLVADTSNPHLPLGAGQDMAVQGGVVHFGNTLRDIEQKSPIPNIV
jgi:hypothetical protein